MLGCNTANGVIFMFTVNHHAVAAYDVDTGVAPVEHEYGLVVFVTTLTRTI